MVDARNDLAPAWAKVLDELGTDPVLESMDKKWLQRVRPVGFQADTVLLAAPNEYAKGVLEHHLRVPVTEVLAAHFGRRVRIAVIVDVGVNPGHLPRYERPQPAVSGTPDHEDGEDSGSTAVRIASEAETVLRKLTPALLAQLRNDAPSTADMLVGLMFRTATLAASTTE